MSQRWEAHGLPDRAASDAHRPQQRLSVAGLHQRAHSVTDPYHSGARHRQQQTVRPVSAQGQRRDSPQALHGHRGPGGGSSTAANAQGATASEYRTPSAAEFYAGVWQPPSSPRHSNVPSVGGYQAPEQPVYASEPALAGGLSYPMSPPYTPAPAASYVSPALGYTYTPPPPPTPSSPYTQYQEYQQPYQTRPFSPVSPQQPSVAWQTHQEPQVPYQQPQGQYAPYRPPVPALKVNHQSSNPPSGTTGQSFIAELPADEIPSARVKPEHQQAVELMAGTPVKKNSVLGEDTAERWADELGERFEKTKIDGQDGYSGLVEVPAPLRIRKSTKKPGDNSVNSAVTLRTGEFGGSSSQQQQQQELDPAHLIHQHLWSGPRQGPTP
ncbi:hypothetical protein PpBr36_02506 [Pyricularia pennisetigena]|uniref:hypothetical protein n=1 Tax=Pyricularia pennisetigena TaxID=1578925 RepID=UPI00114FC1C6|nr:hypothetical protein PpBr36_02506 [Pyricularia pennisetigena]TLS30634.1 hypothetical protein PpBr36_02506 [Pyricularia pennisetigena]